jgi:membrane protease subunit (stomatin/prohibitin family)
LPADLPAFDARLWTPTRALAFAQGLFLVAACDGVAPEERRALVMLLAASGAPADFEALAAMPFDFALARRALDSHWIRRLLVRACRLLAELDGGITDAERDALRAMALGLGVGERLALAPADATPPVDHTAEAFVAWLSSRPLDWISWDDEDQPATFWPFPGGGVPLAPGAKLMVSRGQALVVQAPSGAIDVLGDGVYDATPETLPRLAEAAGWTGGPMTPVLTFVNLGPTDMLRWGSVEPILVPLRSGAPADVPLRAFGRFSVRIADAGRIWGRFCRNGIPSTDDFETRVRRMAAGRFGEALRGLAEGENKGADVLLRESNVIIDRARPAIERAFQEAGLTVRRFELESLTGPLELELRTTGGGRLVGNGAFANPTHGNAAAATPEAVLSCHRCLNAVPPNARFCAQCGASQRKACATCGTDVAVRARFCPQCGSAQTTPP